MTYYYRGEDEKDFESTDFKNMTVSLDEVYNLIMDFVILKNKLTYRPMDERNIEWRINKQRECLEKIKDIEVIKFTGKHLSRFLHNMWTLWGDDKICEMLKEHVHERYEM